MSTYLRWLVILVLMLAIPLAQAGTKHYYYTDAQGTVLAKADAQGNIVATYDYAPYGAQVLGTPPSGPTGYTGHVNDAESGFVYMQARYYDPVVGRFLSVDPVGPSPGNPFNFNRYDYANNNPVRFTDPFGLYSCDREGNGKECDVIAQARGDIKSAASQLPASSSDRHRLVSVLNFLGKEGDKNGVTVSFGSAGGNNAVTDTKGKDVTITFNLKQMSKTLSGHRGGSTLRTETAGILAHEATHGMDGRAIGRNPENFFQEVGTERNGFEAQAAVARGLGVYSAYTVWDPNWSTDASLKRTNAIDRQATRAALYWCKPGVPGC